jgi:TonB family protein
MLSLIADLLIRSALILGAGILLGRWVWKRSPAQRHATLISAFVLLMLWPFLASVVPEIGLPIWRNSAAQGSVTVSQILVSHRTTAPVLGFSPLLVWATVAVIALLPLLIAQLRVRVLLRRAVAITDPAWISLVKDLSTQLKLSRPPMLLVYPDPLMPMTFGLWRPRIVLPGDCDSWSSSRRRIVLLHEMAHIVRRDLATQSFARFLAACWWFQPLGWIALRRIRGESERACDALVIASGIRPSDYAAELLSIAQSFSPNQAFGIAMARAAGLEERLQAILQPSTKASARASLVGISFLTALTVTVSAVTLQPQASTTTSTRGHSMKHSLLAGLLVSAGLSAATIGGSLYDPSGAVVPNAKALLYDPDTNSKFETTTTPDGKFAFETLPAGQYILRVQKPGFATLFREFNVKEDGKVERGLTLALGSAQEKLTVSGEGMPAPSADIKASQPLRVGGAVEQANLLQKVQPLYPKSAKAAGIQGQVVLETVISKDGVPLDIRVVASPDDDCAQSALEAVRQWRYKPTLLNGQPVEIVTDILVNYTLAK